MAQFHRVDTSKLVRGAGRLLYAAVAQAKPAKLSDVIDLTTYNAQSGWSDLGATREGIQISINNTEDSYEIDQVSGAVATAPNAWTCSVTTRLAEFTLENMVLAWEGAPITTDGTTSERETGFAGATSYTQRRLSILFQKPNGKITGYFFHTAQRAPQEGQINFQKSGDPMTIAVQFAAQADPSESDPRKQFFRVREQI